MTEAAIEEYTREAVREAEAYKSPYEQWKESMGIPTIRGLAVQNVYDSDLAPWTARGGSGVFINLDGTGGFNDTYVCEIPAGRSLNAIKHIYDELVFVLSGQGTTTVWIDEAKKQTFEWRARSYFAIPPNAWYQHHNISGTEPARYLAMTGAPRVIDTFKDLGFVFNNPYVFADRFDGEQGYFKETEKPAGRGQWATNFVADVLARPPVPTGVARAGRGGGSTSTIFTMVNSTVRSHIQSWPVGAHTKFHRHGPGIHVLLLRGEGYTLLGPALEEIERVDWAPGTMFVPPEGWWHAHYNTGRDPAVFLAIGWGSDKPKPGGKQYVYKSVREGGDQYEFEDEPPEIHGQFEAELAANGVQDMMGEVHPYCSQSGL